MSSFLLNAISEYGYFGMFLAMILEAVIIVIPSELILATGGILASQNIFSFFGALLTGVIGSVFCAIIIYLMGYYGGRPFIDKYGKYFFMKKEDIEKAEDWFQKYGMLASFIGRNFPIVRTFISLPIGMMHLSFWPFVLYTTLGSIPWTFAFVYVGYSLGNNWVILQEYTSRLKVPIYILLFLLIVRYIYRKIKGMRKK
ncbi:MAG TPA: DedA family protein [Candidatus Scybalousia intestinigallinarum]|nr:DedA family protein [Candidatus Scybalousia intestinigallinarum]